MRMTPERFLSMCRAAAPTVRNCVVVHVTIGWTKSSLLNRVRGTFCTTPKPTAFEHDVDPACLLNYAGNVALNRVLAERVNLCRVGLPASRDDVVDNGPNRSDVATAEKDSRPSRAKVLAACGDRW
jgi:hypothetical protein